MDRPAARPVSPWLAFVAGLLVAAGLIFGFLTWREARNAALNPLPVQLNLPRPPPLPQTPTLPPPPIPTPR